MGRILLYGAYGFTGQLIARRARESGFEPVLAGRDPERLAALGRELGLETRPFSLEDSIAEALEDVDVCVNAAGPFVRTATPMVHACLDTGTDYLDITGEVAVFSALHGLESAARDAGVTLLPGVGWDVVPSDCLAAALVSRLPSASELSLGLAGLGAGRYGGSVSRGTALSALESTGSGSQVRQNGRLVSVDAGRLTRRIDFGRGEATTVALPMGDLVTAPVHTGIQNVTVYVAVPRWAPWALRILDRFGPVLRSGPVLSGARWLVNRTVDGPDEDELETGEAAVWGEATDGDSTVTGRVRTPNPYRFTATATVRAIERVREGTVAPGFQTPASAFGAEFGLESPGVDYTVVDGQ